jgi:peptidoglycan hydrolase CwlO-like protein
MNSSYISLIAMIVAVFFSGIYLRGEGAKKQEIKRELDVIRERQTEIISQVEKINEATLEQDKLLLNRIDSARTYIDLLNAEEAHSSQQIASFGENIKQLQRGIDSSLTTITSSQGFAVQPAPVVVTPSGQ